MLHVSVFINGSCSNGKWVKVNSISWRSIIHDISTHVGTEVSRIFTHDGTEISCSQQLTNGLVIFVSDREDFINLDDHEPSGTIDRLPDEIIEMILKPLSTKDLLNVRLTSSRCLPIATGLCRTRNVRLRTSWFKDPQAKDIFTLYVSRLPPWSSCPLDDLTFGSDFIWMREEFLEEMGQYVLHAQITLDYRMITTLQLLPNLRSVELINPITPKKKRKVMKMYQNISIGVQPFRARTVQLPKLKRIKLDVNHGNINVLESLLHAAAQLNYLDISFNNSNSMPFQEVAHLLAKIPSLTLKLSLPSMSDLNGSSKYQLIVQKLDLDVQEFQIVETQTYVLGLSHCLCSLRLGINIKHGVSAMTTFNPSLPVLKTLKIDFVCRSSATSEAIKNYLESFFSVLDPAQMPLLQEFSISANGLHRKAWLFKSREILFESVTKLEVDNLTYLEDDWIQHFPNVREMTVQGRSQSFRKIFSTMTPLEHLVLKMRRPAAHDLNINKIFAGVDHPGKAYDQIQQYEAGKQKLTPEVKEAMDFSAPILNLTSLKKLELETTRCNGIMACYRTSATEEHPKSHLEDCGVYFSLLQIQSLDFLRLCNAWISLEMEEKLKARHTKFVCERT